MKKLHAVCGNAHLPEASMVTQQFYIFLFKPYINSQEEIVLLHVINL